MFDKLSPQSQELFLYYKNRKNVDKNSVKPYQYEFLFNYIPNETFYFNPDELQQLTQKGNIFLNNDNAINKANIFETFLIDLSWNSSRLEGNNYSLLETQKLIQQNITAGKTFGEATMILNHKKAIQFILENYNNINYNAYDIRGIHYLLAENLIYQTHLGNIRDVPVNISSSNYVPLFNKAEIVPTFSKLLDTLNQIKHPIEQSLFALIHISYLQPFIDCNKRTGRIVCNLPLLKNNLSPLAFVNMDSEFYINGLLAVYEHNETMLIKDVFKHSYENSCNKYLTEILRNNNN